MITARDILKGIGIDIPKIKYDIDVVSKIRLEGDIYGTSYKQGDKIDVNYLQLIQSQKYAVVQWKFQNGEIVGICGQGDSLTYGHDISSLDRIPKVEPHKFDRASKTYTEALQDYLNEVYLNKVTVENRGFSGDCCTQGYNRWNTPHAGDLTIFMYGTNDSRSSACEHVGDIETYLHWYEQLIVRELLWGKAVMLLKSPRTLWANDKRVEAFSNGVELLANKYNIPIIDTTPFVSSYGIEIWSDLTEANKNKICTHFSSKGYPLIGAGIASTLIGESIVNAKHISSGDTLLFREQVDSCKYILPTNTNVLNLEVNSNYTPPERTEGKSIIARMGLGGKIAYSFYTDQEDLVVIPTVYCNGGKKFKMTLDFGVDQPYVNLTTKHEPQVVNTTKIPSEIDLTSPANILYRKPYFADNEIEPLRIVRKGWHTLIVESDDCVFSGLEFMDFSKWCEYKKRFKVKNLGNGILNINYDGKYAELIGKIQVSLPNKINAIQIIGVPSNFKALNKTCSISNKMTDSYCSIYNEGDDIFVEVTNSGILGVDRVAFVDFRIYGYYN